MAKTTKTTTTTTDTSSSLIPPPAVLDARRDNDVTASDVGAICGESAWGTRRSVLRKKALALKSEDTEATIHGRKYEPEAIQKFCTKTGATVTYPGYIKHPVYTWLGGTVDGLASMPNSDTVVIEVKCPYKRQIKESEIPIQYIGQLQTYMEILNHEYCIFIQYKPAGPRSSEVLTILKVHRDRGYMSSHLPALYNFWIDMHCLRAYANSVIVVIQRAWRLYMARKELNQAINTYSRLRGVNYMANLAGFIKKRKLLKDNPSCADIRLSIGIPSTQILVLVDNGKKVAKPASVRNPIPKPLLPPPGTNWRRGGQQQQQPKTQYFTKSAGQCFVII